jgi:hypothetical protein
MKEFICEKKRKKMNPQQRGMPSHVQATQSTNKPLQGPSWCHLTNMPNLAQITYCLSQLLTNISKNFLFTISESFIDLKHMVMELCHG